MYDIPPHVPINVSDYEMELELLAKKHAATIAKVGDQNVEFYDNELSVEEMEDELDDLAGMEVTLPPLPDLEDVSVDEALDALKEELE